MKITAKTLRPKLKMDDVDVYLPRGIAALSKADANPRGFFRIFQRHEGARFFGISEYLGALASLMSQEDIAETVVHAVPESYALGKHETAMTIEGPATALLVNETLLHFLSTGTRFRTLADTYPADRYPWAFMGARYLSSDDLAIATRALAEEDILSTVPRWADRYIGTESHSQIAMWGGLRLDGHIEEVIADVTDNTLVAATIRATVAFALANPGVPLYVLGDFAARSVGCFEVFRATREACDRLDLELLGGRMDISKADLNDLPIIDAALRYEYDRKIAFGEKHKDIYSDQHNASITKEFQGMSLLAVSNVRKLLDEAGLPDFKIIVSGGIKLENIEANAEAGASIIGIGEEAAYYLNKGECNFTSDAVGYFEGERLVPFAKEGRELSRIVNPQRLASATRGFKIAENLVRYNLADYV